MEGHGDCSLQLPSIASFPLPSRELGAGGWAGVGRKASPCLLNHIPHIREATYLAAVEEPGSPVISTLPALQKHFSPHASRSAWPRCPGTVKVMESKVVDGKVVKCFVRNLGSMEKVGEEDAPVTEEEGQQGRYLHGA